VAEFSDMVWAHRSGYCFALCRILSIEAEKILILTTVPTFMRTSEPPNRVAFALYKIALEIRKNNQIPSKTIYLLPIFIFAYEYTCK